MRGSIDTTADRSFAPGPALGAAFAMVLLTAATAASLDGMHSLISLAGLVIVFGGVTAAAFMSFHPEDVYQALGSIVAMLKGASLGLNVDLQREMEDMVGWSRVVCEQGTRSLERALARHGTRDPFVNYGLTLVVSDYVPDDVRLMMETAADGGYQRASVPVEVLRAMASHAPAFGMVGTLVGMISMLHGLANDAEAIGGTLAVAFLSTLYGVLSARMIYMPAAARLERQVEAWRLRDDLVTEGTVLLACRKSPMFVRDRLNAFLHPQAHAYFNVIDGLAEPGRAALTSASSGVWAFPRRLRQVIAS